MAKFMKKKEFRKKYKPIAKKLRKERITKGKEKLKKDFRGFQKKTKAVRKYTKGLYRKGSQRKGSATRKLVSSITRTPSYIKSSRGRGRPSGTYKYVIPGKGPVSITTYRAYKAKMKAMEQLQRGRDTERESRMEHRRDTRREAPRQPEQHHRPSLLNANSPFNNDGQEWKDRPAKNPLPNSLDQQKPITNPRGEYYTEIDPASGKSLIRRRPSERWTRAERD